MNTDTHPKIKLPSPKPGYKIILETCPHCGKDWPLLKRKQLYACFQCGRFFDEFLREVYRA